MNKKYLLLSEEILKAKYLRNPKYKHSKIKTDSQLLKFSPTYKVILWSLISLLTPKTKRIRKKEITYKEIADFCGLPERTVKLKMPIIRHNFPYLVNVIKREYGSGYTYKLNPNFAKELLREYEYYDAMILNQQTKD